MFKNNDVRIIGHSGEYSNESNSDDEEEYELSYCADTKIAKNDRKIMCADNLCDVLILIENCI